MRAFSCLVVICAALFLSGCVTQPKPDYSTFFDHQPRSILVVPPANKTTAVDAPAVFLTTVSAAFAERGYYVFPVFLVQDVLNDLGATDEGAIAAIPPEKFKEVFGADSILYVTITDWTTSYVVLASNIIVGAEYRLVDAGTGAVLWTGKQKVVHGGSAGGGGGLIGALVVAAVNAAVTATTVQYRPIALQANTFVAKQSGHGLPAGPYHPEFQKDREQFK
ncbi:MAG: GNA1162 family protein [Nitrospiraceae bacterium]